MKHIYDKIYKEEVDENVFNAFFSYIDSFNKVTGAQREETADKSGPAVQKSIFEFLTAKGIPGLTDAPESNKKIKQRKRMEEEEAESKKAEISSTTQSNEPEVQPEAAAN